MYNSKRLSAVIIFLLAFVIICVTISSVVAQQSKPPQRGQQAQQGQQPQRGQQAQQPQRSQQPQRGQQDQQAQPTAPPTPEEITPKIPNDKRLWSGMPWLVGAVLTGLTLLVSFKNAKRSHLD